MTKYYTLSPAGYNILYMSSL